MHIRQIASAALAVSLTFVPPGHAATAPSPELGVSGYMTPNADGSASFEFRVANQRPDMTVTGFTVTVAFYDRTVKAESKLAEYHWFFLSEVPPNQQLLEYGVLDAKKVADLTKRHIAATGRANPDPLSTAVYTYEAKVDAQAFAPKD